MPVYNNGLYDIPSFLATFWMAKSSVRTITEQSSEIKSFAKARIEMSRFLILNIKRVFEDILKRNRTRINNLKAIRSKKSFDSIIKERNAL